MSLISKLGPNLTCLRQLWANRRTIRQLLASENYIFVRDFPPGHFYSPIPSLSDALNAHGSPTNGSTAVVAAIALNGNAQTALVEGFANYYRELPFSEKPAENGRYHLDNPFFSYGDGIILYSFMRHFRPRRVVEVGSGFSSAAMLDVNDRFFESGIEFTFVEPFPDRLHSLLSAADRRSCRILVQRVQEVEIDVFESLQRNDVLFVDSSHVGKTGSDVLHLLFNVLPLLRKGVLVHFHDIIWPFEYPAIWLQGGRAWNEAYFLRAFMQYNPAFEILYFNSFMAARHAAKVRSALPRALIPSSFKDTIGNSSLWLRKVT